MATYPNILTPPSSSEDSPQSHFYNSPSYGDVPFILPQTSLAFDLDGGGTATAPYLRILEQPIDRFRFRYKSEMTGTHGSLCGQTSDRNRKQTYPTIELCNFNKRAVVRCSIYQHHTKDDHKPHAHRLIKKQGKGEVDDPHDGYVGPDEGYVYTFHSMGIIHTAKKNLVPELVKKKTQLKKEEVARMDGKVRELIQKEEIEIKGLAESESKLINLNVVVLRFDAFFEANGFLLPICPPVYSHAINNLKSALTGELKIVRMDHCTSPAKGGREVFILVERVTKKNIKVRFYELDDEDCVIWEDYGKFSDLDVHHQYAIVFKTPPYRDLNIQKSVRVFIELERPSDRARSEPREFTYTVSPNSYRPGAKRARPSYGSSMSYDSSLASDELPVTINNLSIGNPILDDCDLEVSSAELHQAITNMSSNEFKKIFNEFRNDYMTFDAPKDREPRRAFYSSQVCKNKIVKVEKPLFQRFSSPEEKLQAKQAIIELQNFIKTQPSSDKAINMLNHYLNHENKTNALHISIRENEIVDVMFLLKMIYVWKQYDLLNVRSDYYETPLHIAVLQNSEEIVANLIVCRADVLLGDADMNTPLHLAVLAYCSITIFEKILSADNAKEIINYENIDGNTAMNLAIDNSNLRAVKFLCLNGADVNQLHKKSGFTPLRFAVEKQTVEIISYILQHSDIDPTIEDFRGITPLQAAMKKDQQVLNVVTEFMKKNNYTEVDIEIKQEVDYCSDEEFEEKFNVKLEQVSIEELREMYSNITNFTPTVLNELAEILDKSESWKDLADLLDFGHLLRSGLCDSNSNSPTKVLLKLALETNGDTVLQIRDFLENLDECHAVEIIDNMVKSQISF